jgi:predicted metalloprotease with PDZ domain
VLLALVGVAGGCSEAGPPPASVVAAPVARHTELPAPAATDSLSIRFDALAPGRGLSLSLDVVGDADGETTFRIAGCCGIDAADRFVEDVRFVVDGQPLPARRDGSGWTVRHAPRAPVTVRYRLVPSGVLTIDAGPLDQFRPIVRDDAFQLIGDTALLLPAGRPPTEAVAVAVDATRVSDAAHFASSFGPGNVVGRALVSRTMLGRSLFVGGAVSLQVHDTATGRIGIVHDAMDPGLRVQDLHDDVLAIVAAERAFFHDAEPWYLVSVRGGARSDPGINIGGGTGLDHALAVFAWSGLDLAHGEQHRAQLRWVLAHEYFHRWDGLTLRVATDKATGRDDASAYWFTEGVTEFYTMRLLTRGGLQAPSLSVAVLDDRLRRHAANPRRDLDITSAGKRFWTDADAEQIPYVRGYLAAWQADLALVDASQGKRSLDDVVRELVARAQAEPGFRIDNAFLLDYFDRALPAAAAARLRRFVSHGGDAPLDAGAFAPCLAGKRERIGDRDVLQFDFADPADEACFRH